MPHDDLDLFDGPEQMRQPLSKKKQHLERLKLEDEILFDDMDEIADDFNRRKGWNQIDNMHKPFVRDQITPEKSEPSWIELECAQKRIECVDVDRV